MPYGKEAKNELLQMVEGKSLRIIVYAEDRYGRFVGDIYCNGSFVQVIFLNCFALSDFLLFLSFPHILFCHVCKGIDAEEGFGMALRCLRQTIGI